MDEKQSAARTASKASLGSIADGQSQLSLSEARAAPVTLIKQRSIKIGDANLSRRDTGEVLYTTVTRYPSLHVDICRGADSSGKAMATIRTWSLDFQGVSGFTNVKESDFLYSHKPLAIQRFFKVKHIEYAVCGSWLCGTVTKIMRSGAVEDSEPIMTVEAKTFANSGHIYLHKALVCDGPGSEQPADALLVEGKPTELLDMALLATYVFRRNRRRRGAY